jgi:hypothetical protein
LFSGGCSRRRTEANRRCSLIKVWEGDNRERERTERERRKIRKWIKANWAGFLYPSVFWFFHFRSLTYIFFKLLVIIRAHIAQLVSTPVQYQEGRVRTPVDAFPPIFSFFCCFVLILGFRPRSANHTPFPCYLHPLFPFILFFIYGIYFI